MKIRLILVVAALVLSGVACTTGSDTFAEASACDQILADIEALAHEAGEMPDQANYHRADGYGGTTMPDHIAYEGAMNTWRYKLRAMLNLIVASPDCNSARKVAEAEAFLDGMK